MSAMAGAGVAKDSMNRRIVVSELRHDARDALVQRAAPLDERRLRQDFADRQDEQRQSGDKDPEVFRAENSRSGRSGR